MIPETDPGPVYLAGFRDWAEGGDETAQVRYCQVQFQAEKDGVAIEVRRCPDPGTARDTRTFVLHLDAEQIAALYQRLKTNKRS